MKAILLMFDSLNRHFLPPYGCEWIHAPNFRRLAERSVTFDRAYAGSLPCMPARRDLHTGRLNFLHRSWGPLEPFDDSMPQILGEHGVHTHLVTDHQHYWEDGGATYHNRYSTYEFVRGQEGDRWKGHVAPLPPFEHLGAAWRQDRVNRPYLSAPGAHPQQRTLQNGLEFIETNRDADNWFLQIETFDPHEPFFAPEKFRDLYRHDYNGPHFDWPSYRRVNETPEQVEHCRLEYAALLSMCDQSLGRVLDAMDEGDLWDDTLLIVNTDHGFLLGEHEWWAKMVQPFYEEVVHVPLFVHDPRQQRAGTRCEALVQMTDVAPTLLEWFGAPLPPDMRGQTLGKAMQQGQAMREAVLFGAHGGHLNVCDGRHVLLRGPRNPQEPLYEYTLMPTRMRRLFTPGELQDATLCSPFSFSKGCPLLRIPARTGQAPGGESIEALDTLLFDVQNDPQQQTPLHDPQIEAALLAHMARLMRENDAPPELFRRYDLPL